MQRFTKIIIYAKLVILVLGLIVLALAGRSVWDCYQRSRTINESLVEYYQPLLKTERIKQAASALSST